jgi:photosystem II stability/assembly factor-like uncharacterized protein
LLLKVCDLDIRGYDILVACSNAPVGIWHSTDGGRNWFRSDTGIRESSDTTVEVTTFQDCRRSPDNPDIAMARHAAATYRSTDGGYHWSLIDGKIGMIGGDDHLRWNPFRPGEAWTCGATSVFSPYLVAFTDYGANVKLSVDFNSLGFYSDDIIGDVAFDCGNSEIIYAATTEGLIKSTDGGYNWIRGKAIIPDSGYVRFIVEHRSKPGVLFLSGYTSIYYSADHGETMHILSQVPRVVESMEVDEDGRRIFVGSARGVYAVSFSSVVN